MTKKRRPNNRHFLSLVPPSGNGVGTVALPPPALIENAGAALRKAGYMAQEVDQISHQLGQLTAQVATLTAEVHKLRGTMFDHNQQLVMAYAVRDQVQAHGVRIDAIERREGERARLRHKIIGFALGASVFGGAGGSVAGPKLWAWLMRGGM